MPAPGSPSATETLAAMRGSLQQLNASPFAPTAQTLDAQLAQVQTKSAALAPEDLAKFGLAVQTMAQVLPGVTSGVLLALEGFEDGDELSGIQGVMDSCASLAPLVGLAIGAGIGSLVPVAGTLVGAQVGVLVGLLVGSIFSMISDILGFFAPKTETLAQTIQNLLQNQKADEVHSGIKRAHSSFLIYASLLNDECGRIASSNNFHPGVAAKVIQEMNFVEGNTMTTYWDVVDWLANPENQTHRRWPLILNGACSAYTVLLVAVIRLHSLVTSNAMLKRYSAADAAGKADLKELWEAAAAKLEVYGVASRIHLAQLRELTQPAQYRGTLWRIEPHLQVGVVDPRVAPATVGNDGWEWNRISATVCSKEQTLPEPAYQVYGLGTNNKLYHWQVESDRASNQKIGYKTMESSQDPLAPDLKDVFATPGTDLNMENHACVYELSHGNKIVGKYRAENGKELGTFCTFTLPSQDAELASLTSVRAVHDPYSAPDDSRNSALRDVKFLVYATAEPKTAHESIHRILLLINGTEKRLVFNTGGMAEKPIGIAVDQDYLWAFSARKFAFATHASVVHFAKHSLAGGMPHHPGDEPAWITCADLPPGANGIASLYPCDDGTLVVSVDGSHDVYCAGYRVDLQKGRLTAYDGQGPLKWTKIRDCRAQGGMEKLPLFCWPQFESLRETLEALQQTFARG
jgi:hypothetical protein